MLVMAYGNCQKCNQSLSGSFFQDISSTCEKCGKNFKLCKSCQESGCPECHGKLETSLECATRNGFLI